MLHSFMYLSPIAVLIALITLSLQRHHLLIALLALEAIILSLTLIVTSYIIIESQSELILALVILTFGACEASLGLACIVALSRALGNDLCKIIAITKW